MSYTSMNCRHMSNASAQYAQTNSSCAHAASMQFANCITMIMGAIIMASIIISAILGLIILAGLIRIALVSVLVSVILTLVTVYFCLPDVRRSA